MTDPKNARTDLVPAAPTPYDNYVTGLLELWTYVNANGNDDKSEAMRDQLDAVCEPLSAGEQLRAGKEFVQKRKA